MLICTTTCLFFFPDLTNDYRLPDEDESIKFINEVHQTSPLQMEPSANVIKIENDAIVPTLYLEDSSPEPSPTSSEKSFYPKKESLKPEPVFKENRQLEFLIDAVMSCQDAVYPNLKKQYSESMQEMHFKIFVSFIPKQIRTLTLVPRELNIHLTFTSFFYRSIVYLEYFF